jgi:hypothetical protein
MDRSVSSHEDEHHLNLDLDDRLRASRRASACHERRAVSARVVGGNLLRGHAGRDRELLSSSQRSRIGCRLSAPLCLESSQYVDGDQRKDPREEERAGGQDRHRAGLSCTPPVSAHPVSWRMVALDWISISEGKSHVTSGTTIGARYRTLTVTADPSPPSR